MENDKLTDKEKRFIKQNIKSNKIYLIAFIIMSLMTIYWFLSFLSGSVKGVVYYTERSLNFSYPQEIKQIMYRIEFFWFLAGVFWGICLGLIGTSYILTKKWLKVINK